MFSNEQREYILKHLRRPDNDLEIAKIAQTLAKKYGKISDELVLDTASIMNLGETDSRIAHIYEVSCNWKEHPEAIDLNKLHGEYSVEMAESIGITLSEEQKQVISGHSRNEYSTVLGQIIKIAEICRATEQPRWYRGEKKDAAKSWDEVESVLLEDKGLSNDMIAIAKKSYGKQRFKDIDKSNHDDVGEIS